MKIFLLITTLNLAFSTLSDNYKIIKCSLTPITRHSKSHTNISHPFIPGPEADTRGTQKTSQTSTNWAGYVAANNLQNPSKNSVTAVAGSWKIPHIQPIKNKATYAAFWIGIDGYSSETVEQIGTSCDIDEKGNKSYYAWFEMFPQPSYQIINFPLEQGDTISALVSYSGNNTFTMSITNQTKKITYTVPTGYTKSTVALRNCAEWIAEAPWMNSTLPLTNFGTVFFSACSAIINGKNMPIQNSFWKNSPINMIVNSTTNKAVTSALTPTPGSFSIAWKHQ